VTTFFHSSLITLNAIASILAVLCFTPRPPLGVSLLGLFITAISSTLYLLPCIIFCNIIVLSIWVPSRPADIKVIYYPVDGYSQHVYADLTSDATPPADESGSFELNACLGVLFFPAFHPGHVDTREPAYPPYSRYSPSNCRVLVRYAPRATSTSHGLLARHVASPFERALFIPICGGFYQWSYGK